MKPHCCFHTEELPSGEDENGMNRSSHRRGSLKKSRPQICNFIKKRLQRRCFPVNIAKLLRTSILKNICERLLLNEKTLTNFDNYMVTAAYLEKCYLFYLQYVVNYSIIFCGVWQISQLLHCGRFHRNLFPRFGKK